MPLNKKEIKLRLEYVKDLAKEAGYVKCSAAVAGVLMFLCALRRLVGNGGKKSDRDRKLGDTWSSAAEYMLSEAAVGSNVVLVPAVEQPEESSDKLSLPDTLCTHLLFAFTAFDPPGEARTLEENEQANGRMWESIKLMEPSPAKVWPTWGYNLKEDWREDGFCLAFPVKDGEKEAECARAAVISIAKEFGQGAVFEYCKGENDNSMLRTTVPVLSSDDIRKEVTVWRVPETFVSAPYSEEVDGDEKREEVGSILLTRPWAGPDEIWGAKEEAKEPATATPPEGSFKSVKDVLADMDKESARQRKSLNRIKVGALSPIKQLFS